MGYLDIFNSILVTQRTCASCNHIDSISNTIYPFGNIGGHQLRHHSLYLILSYCNPIIISTTNLQHDKALGNLHIKTSGGSFCTAHCYSCLLTPFSMRAKLSN